ncbi:MAG: CoA ester lyase [Candidatus Cloacimonadota bacterium]|nr:MAG: CoA ester lyase [Candidatus Cloacimonadota bacterium]
MKYILRSLLFVPGNKEDLMLKAAKTNADAIIFDLEDSVLDTAKQKARHVIKNILETDLFDKFHIFIRLNDIGSGYLEEDVSQLICNKITGFIFPKAYTRDDVLHFEKILKRAEQKAGIQNNKFKILPLIETASAVLHAEDICRCSERIIAIVFGSEDFCTDLKGIHDKTHDALFVPRALIALAARAAGIIPIDTLNVNLNDMEDLERNLKLGRKLGFEGKLLLHPKEIELTHQYFTPSEKEYEKALKIIKLAQEAAKQNLRVAIIDDTFIGPPMVRQAENTISRFKQIKKWEEFRRK